MDFERVIPDLKAKLARTMERTSTLTEQRRAYALEAGVRGLASSIAGRGGLPPRWRSFDSPPTNANISNIVSKWKHRLKMEIVGGSGH